MNSYKVMPDIIGVNETKLNKNSDANYILKGYNFHFVNFMSNARGVSI